MTPAQASGPKGVREGGPDPGKLPDGQVLTRAAGNVDLLLNIVRRHSALTCLLLILLQNFADLYRMRATCPFNIKVFCGICHPILIFHIFPLFFSSDLAVLWVHHMGMKTCGRKVGAVQADVGVLLNTSWLQSDLCPPPYRLFQVASTAKHRLFSAGNVFPLDGNRVPHV